MSIPPGPWRFKLAATVIPAVPPPTIKTLWCVVPAIMALPSNWPARCGLGHSLAKHRIIILNPMSIAVQHAQGGAGEPGDRDGADIGDREIGVQRLLKGDRMRRAVLHGEAQRQGPREGHGVDSAE